MPTKNAKGILENLSRGMYMAVFKVFKPDNTLLLICLSSA